jgi:seryl-tRNA synthetase
LKKEIEVLEAEKVRISTEIGGLPTTRADAENFRKEAEVLRKQMEDAKSAEAVAVERASKAVETTENLHEEIDVEKKSGLAQQQQVGLLMKRLEASKELGQTMVDLYVAALLQFGSSTSDLPEEPFALSHLLG